MPRFVLVEDDLDLVSNSVVDLINEKRFDEALLVCERLRTEYPDAIDWLERVAMVHRARGEHALAADFYRRALAFAEQPDQRDGFDDELRDDYRRSALALEARAADAATATRQT
jgi:tetratricopeptide (TPR) repeat protein